MRCCRRGRRCPKNGPKSRLNVANSQDYPKDVTTTLFANSASSQKLNPTEMIFRVERLSTKESTSCEDSLVNNLSNKNAHSSGNHRGKSDDSQKTCYSNGEDKDGFKAPPERSSRCREQALTNGKEATYSSDGWRPFRKGRHHSRMNSSEEQSGDPSNIHCFVDDEKNQRNECERRHNGMHSSLFDFRQRDGGRRLLKKEERRRRRGLNEQSTETASHDDVEGSSRNAEESIVEENSEETSSSSSSGTSVATAFAECSCFGSAPSQRTQCKWRQLRIMWSTFFLSCCLLFLSFVCVLSIE